MLKPVTDQTLPSPSDSSIDTIDSELAVAVAAGIAQRRAGRSTEIEMRKIEAVSRRRKQYLRQRTRAFA